MNAGLIVLGGLVAICTHAAAYMLGHKHGTEDCAEGHTAQVQRIQAASQRFARAAVEQDDERQKDIAALQNKLEHLNRLYKHAQDRLLYVNMNYDQWSKKKKRGKHGRNH